MKIDEIEYLIQLIYKDGSWAQNYPVFPLACSSLNFDTDQLSEKMEGDELSIDDKKLLDDMMKNLMIYDEKAIQRNLIEKGIILVVEKSKIIPNEENEHVKSIRTLITNTIFKFKFESIVASKFIGAELRVFAVLLSYSSLGLTRIPFNELCKKAQVRRDKFPEIIQFWQNKGFVLSEEKLNPNSKYAPHSYYYLDRSSVEKCEKFLQIEKNITDLASIVDRPTLMSEFEHRIVRVIDRLFNLFPNNYQDVIRSNWKKQAQEGNMIEIPLLLRKLKFQWDNADPKFLPIILQFDGLIDKDYKPVERKQAIKDLYSIRNKLIIDYNAALFDLLQDYACIFFMRCISLESSTCWVPMGPPRNK